MTRIFKLSAVLLLAFGISVTLRAQLPQNNDTWKTRCDLLAASANAIENGHPPAVLVAATRGVSSHSFFVLAVNRSQEEQHYVSCALYYMAAIAAREGNGGKTDLDAANDYLVLAGAEVKSAHGQSLTMAEYFKQLKIKASGLTGQSLTSTPAQTEAAIVASSTMPLSLTPPVTTAHR
jgi:hypothetical protein